MNRIVLTSCMVALVALAVGCGEPPTFATGASAEPNPGIAGRQAARQAIAALNGKPLKGLVYTVYYPRRRGGKDDYLPDPKAEEAAARAIAMAAGKVPNIGVRARGMTREGTMIDRGVTVLAIGGKDTTCAATAIPILADRRDTGRRVAEGMDKVSQLKLTICLSEMLLAFEPRRGVAPDDFLRGLTGNLPRGSVVWGGNGMNDPAASAKDALSGRQFYFGKPMSGYVVALGVGGDMTLVTDTAHEFVTAEKPVTATEVQGDWIVTLDGKPALDVYRAAAGVKAKEKLTSDWCHGMGLRVGSSGTAKPYVRMIADWVDSRGRDAAGKKTPQPKGSIRLSSPVAKGQVMYVLHGGDDTGRIVASEKQSIAASLKQVRSAGRVPSLVLISDCCTRGMRLRGGQGASADPVTLGVAGALGGESPAVFGFYAFGQIGRIDGRLNGLDHQFQEQTLVTTVVGTPPAPAQKPAKEPTREASKEPAKEPTKEPAK